MEGGFELHDLGGFWIRSISRNGGRVSDYTTWEGFRDQNKLREKKNLEEKLVLYQLNQQLHRSHVDSKNRLRS